MTGKEVAQRVIEHVTDAWDREAYDELKIGRYLPNVPGRGYHNVPAGHAWISNFDVENLWDHKDLPNLKPQCKKIVEVLEKWLSGQTNKEINKVVNKKPRVTVDLNDYYKVGDVVMLHPDGCYWVRDKYDYQLFRITKVCKTKAYVMPLKCETNVDEALHNIKYYGESATWYRKYKKEDVTTTPDYYLDQLEVSAKELYVRAFKGKLHIDTGLVKFYDVESGKILMERYADGDEIVIKNDKYWYD